MNMVPGERLGGKDKTVIDDLPPFWPDNDVVRTDMLDYAFEVEYYDNLVNRFLDELEKRAAGGINPDCCTPISLTSKKVGTKSTKLT